MTKTNLPDDNLYNLLFLNVWEICPWKSSQPRKKNQKIFSTLVNINWSSRTVEVSNKWKQYWIFITIKIVTSFIVVQHTVHHWPDIMITVQSYWTWCIFSNSLYNNINSDVQVGNNNSAPACIAVTLNHSAIYQWQSRCTHHWPTVTQG